ncbi:MAG: hypothetical protein FJ035_03310 [Chloroflexi bacterium]|nr:hypothetical protein [Chloroflexota bacterium]
MTTPPIGRAELQAVAAHFASALTAPVAIDVWTQAESTRVRTDRDPCTHCPGVLAAARQLAGLHVNLSLTLYDVDRHAARARQAGVELLPLTVLRGRAGRELRVHGLWSGLLFGAVIDALVMLSSGDTPLTDAHRERLGALDAVPADSVALEVLGAPYDVFSAHMLRLCAALATETPRLRPRFIEIVEFPRLAAVRAVHEVPITYVGTRPAAGQRFVGVWDESELVEQLARAAAGDSTPVERAQLLASPYHTEAELFELAQQEQPPPEPGPQPGERRPGGFQARPSGLYVPHD